MNILIDAFGGDDAPLEVIKGGALAVQQLGVTVTLVGDEEKIRSCAAENGLSLDGMEILHAPAVFDIHEEPTTLLKQHRDTSMAVGMQALHDGIGDHKDIREKEAQHDQAGNNDNARNGIGIIG